MPCQQSGQRSEGWAAVLLFIGKTVQKEVLLTCPFSIPTFLFVCLLLLVKIVWVSSLVNFGLSLSLETTTNSLCFVGALVEGASTSEAGAELGRPRGKPR